MCEVAYQYLVPFIDLGTEIGMKAARVLHSAGHMDLVSLCPFTLAGRDPFCNLTEP
jgi:hypothetical protein